MLREMAKAIDAITTEQSLILWLEDLHWSDVSTIELVALLARRREPARLLIMGTYRPVDVIMTEHPLKAAKQELQLHGQCAELTVRLLSEEHIAQYLAVRWEKEPSRDHEGAAQRSLAEGRGSDILRTVAQAIHRRTEGNPLFMVNVVDELLAQGQLDTTTVEISAPSSIRQLIEQHLERLSAEEQQMLEVASVAGIEFSVATVAAGTEAAIETVEEQRVGLVRRGQFLQTKGTAAWPDGIAGLGADQARTGRRKHCANTAGSDVFPGHRSRAGAVRSSSLAGRGVWECGTGRGRVGCADCGAGVSR
jgi:predicted ATPase